MESESLTAAPACDWLNGCWGEQKDDLQERRRKRQGLTGLPAATVLMNCGQTMRVRRASSDGMGC